MRKLNAPTAARVVKQASTEWYILWRNDSTRYRFKNGLNRIKDLEVRQEWANQIVAFINAAALQGDVPNEAAVRSYFKTLSAESPPPLPSVKKNLSFDEFFTEFITSRDKLLAEATTKSRISSRNNLRFFADDVLKKTALDWTDFDGQLPLKLATWGYAPPRSWSQNTLAKTLSTLRVVLSEAAEQGHPTGTAWKSKKYRLAETQTDSIALTLKELRHLADSDLSAAPERLQNVRDVFVLACFTGLRYSDVSKLRRSNFKRITRDNGETVEVLEIVQQKTARHDGRVVIPLHPTVKRILSAHNGKPPAAYSNQKMNDYLKELGAWVGLTEEITFRESVAGKTVVQTLRQCDALTMHTARRTFATIAFVEWCIPSALIMQVTGHKSERDFLKYIKIQKESAALQMLAYFK